jgi:hypothetical protein
MLLRRVLLFFSIIAITIVLVFGATLAVAQIPEYAISYDEGLVRFDYDQYPWGSIEGTYTADGPVWNDDFTFPGGASNGSGGVMEIDAVNDTNNVIAMSAIINANGTVDAAVVFVAFAGVPAPGSFNVELGGMEAGFVWLDDVSNITFPENNDFEAWFNGIEAAGKYVGMSGSIVVTQVDTEKFVGTFTGRMVNPGNFVMLDILSGVFDITNVYAAPAAPALPVAAMSAYPNPFNPQTVIALEMPRTGQALVQIFDMRGRRIRELAAGSFTEGRHSWVWDGTDDQGQRLSGGLYVARALGQGWSVNQKLVYVP